MNRLKLLPAAIALAASHGIYASEPASVQGEGPLEEIVVRAKMLGFGETRANNTIEIEAIESEAPANDVLNYVNRLPGVNVTQGDAYGGNDWSSKVYIRGMANDRGASQVGYMIDNVPNGDSTYGGGTKPNRYVDSENLLRINVAQNAADISSASNEALGGTIRYYTDDPSSEGGARISASGGDFGLRRYYLRGDSGELAPGLTAYVSYSDTHLETWPGDHSGEFERKHLNLKVVKEFENGLELKLRHSQNKRVENDYDSVTLAQFRQDPRDDGLTDRFTGDPLIDQNYRPSWGGNRWDDLTYIEVNYDFAEGSRFTFTPYHHYQRGYGWWMPPYVIAPLGADAESGRGPLAFYRDQYARDAQGNLVEAEGTDVSGYACLAPFYTGASVDYAIAADFDCATAERAATRRRSGYWNHRSGVTGELDLALGDTFNLKFGGWYETQDRDNDRRWFNISDTGNRNLAYDRPHYYLDFDRNWDSTTQKLYTQGEWKLMDERLSLDAGLVWHRVSSDFYERLEDVKRDQSSDALMPKLGALYRVNDGVEMFASFAENFRAVPESAMEGGNTDQLDPETSRNWDLGVRVDGGRFGLVAQVFLQQFSNRIGARRYGEDDGDQFLQRAAAFVNIGGVDSRGLETALSFDISDELELFASYSYIDSEFTKSNADEGIARGNRPVNIPEHMAFAEILWRPAQLEGLQLGLNGKYVGEREGTLDNSEQLDSYWVAGFKASYQLPVLGMGIERLSLSASVDNLFDEEYLSSPDGVAASDGVYFIGAPRTAALTLRADF